MLKFRLFYDKDKMESWLNQMSEKGWALEHFYFGFCFFRPCEPGEYIYRLDMLRSIEGQDYKSFMKEMDIETVQQWFRWVVLRKKSADGPFELYTDEASLIEKYTRIRNFFKFFVIISIVLMAHHTIVLLRTGEIYLLILILLYCLLIILFIRQAVRSNQKIMKLKRKGVDGEDMKKLPLLLCIGLFVNGVNLFMRMVWKDFFNTGAGYNISFVISIVALGMILIGIIQQRMKMNRA